MLRVDLSEDERATFRSVEVPINVLLKSADSDYCLTSEEMREESASLSLMTKYVAGRGLREIVGWCRHNFQGDWTIEPAAALDDWHLMRRWITFRFQLASDCETFRRLWIERLGHVNAESRASN